MHIREWKLSNLLKFQVCSSGFNLQRPGINLDDGLAPIHWRIYAAIGEDYLTVLAANKRNTVYNVSYIFFNVNCVYQNAFVYTTSFKMFDEIWDGSRAFVK